MERRQPLLQNLRSVILALNQRLSSDLSNKECAQHYVNITKLEMFTFLSVNPNQGLQ
jgi:hypothetical protein